MSVQRLNAKDVNIFGCFFVFSTESLDLTKSKYPWHDIRYENNDLLGIFWILEKKDLIIKNIKKKLFYQLFYENSSLRHGS